MKNIGLICLLFIMVLNIQAQEKIQDFKSFYQEGMKCAEGILPVYYKGKNIYLEVNEKLLGREFLITTQIEEGFGKRGRWLKTPGVFRINRGERGCLWIQQEILSERITGKDGSLREILQASSRQPVERELPVVAIREERKGYIVDISDLLKGRNKWFEWSEEGVRGMKEGSASLKEAESLKDGVVLKIKGRFGYASSRQLAGNMLSPEGYMPLEICWVLKVLPFSDMPLRYADARIPYRAIHFMEYGKNPYGGVKDSVIERWRGDKPLFFYIDSCCPPQWIKYIREGVFLWNKAFQKAGFGKNWLQVRVAGRGSCLAAEPLVIAYDLGKPEVKAERKVNERTGEILAGRINIGHGFAWQWCWKYRMLHHELSKSDEEVMGEILKEKIMESVGYLLGLRQECMEGKVGAAACLAVAWGYQDIRRNKAMTEEESRSFLCHWLTKQGIQSEMDFQKLCRLLNLNDLSDRMENLMGFYRKIEEIVYPEGITDYGNRLRRVDKQGYKLYVDYLSEAVGYVGGNSVLSLKVMEFLQYYLFDFDPLLLTSPFLIRNPLRNAIPLPVAVQPVFEKLLSREIQGDLINARKSSGSYTCRKLFEDIDRLLFKNWQADKLNAWEMELQASYLRAFCKSIKAKEIEKAEDDYDLMMLVEYRRLKEKLRMAAQTCRHKRIGDFYEMLGTMM